MNQAFALILSLTSYKGVSYLQKACLPCRRIQWLFQYFLSARSVLFQIIEVKWRWWWLPNLDSFAISSILGYLDASYLKAPSHRCPQKSAHELRLVPSFHQRSREPHLHFLILGNLSQYHLMGSSKLWVIWRATFLRLLVSDPLLSAK